MRACLDGVNSVFFNAVQACRKVVHITVQPFLCHFCVHLRGGYVLMSQYGAYSFNGDTIGQAHFRSHRVPAHVPSDVLFYTASFGYCPYAMQTGHIVGNGEDFAVLTKSSIFGEYL